MSQASGIVSNGDGGNVRAQINENLQAILSTSKGGSPPATAYPCQLWVDDNTPSATVWTLSIYDGAEWIPMATIDTASNTISFLANTAPPDTNSSQVATTAFVLGQVASQAQMEAGIGATKLVTPGRQHFHPSAAKFWVLFNGITNAIAASYNVSSIVDLGVGQFRVNYFTPFSSALYSVVGFTQDNGSGAGAACTMGAGGRFAGSVDVLTLTPQTGALADSASVNVMGYGNQ